MSAESQGGWRVSLASLQWLVAWAIAGGFAVPFFFPEAGTGWWIGIWATLGFVFATSPIRSAGGTGQAMLCDGS